MLLDKLGHPINVGDTVLAKGYNSADYELFTIVQVAKVRVYIEQHVKLWTRDATTHLYVAIDTIKKIPRYPSDIIVVNAQLEHNRKHYPEHQL